MIKYFSITYQRRKEGKRDVEIAESENHQMVATGRLHLK